MKIWAPSSYDPPPLVNVTLPVYNEAAQLAASVRRVTEFLAGQPQWRWEVVIADNGSTDETRRIAEEMAGKVQRLGVRSQESGSRSEKPEVDGRKAEFRIQESELRSPKSEAEPGSAVPLRVVHLEQAGRGRALKAVWLASEADVLSYLDVDLSTDLAHLPELIGVVAEGRADLALGSRLLPASRTTRGWKRELLSRGYNWLLHRALGLRVTDAQCGFKAISRRAAQALLPPVQDSGFFFDTELLVLAQRQGWRIAELPVRWVDAPDSRVRLLRTIGQDLKGVWRLRR